MSHSLIFLLHFFAQQTPRPLPSKRRAHCRVNAMQTPSTIALQMTPVLFGLIYGYMILKYVTCAFLWMWCKVIAWSEMEEDDDWHQDLHFSKVWASSSESEASDWEDLPIVRVRSIGTQVGSQCVDRSTQTVVDVRSKVDNCEDWTEDDRLRYDLLHFVPDTAAVAEWRRDNLDSLPPKPYTIDPWRRRSLQMCLDSYRELQNRLPSAKRAYASGMGIRTVRTETVDLKFALH